MGCTRLFVCVRVKYTMRHSTQIYTYIANEIHFKHIIDNIFYFNTLSPSKTVAIRIRNENKKLSHCYIFKRELFREHYNILFSYSLFVVQLNVVVLQQRSVRDWERENHSSSHIVVKNKYVWYSDYTNWTHLTFSKLNQTQSNLCNSSDVAFNAFLVLIFFSV